LTYTHFLLLLIDEDVFHEQAGQIEGQQQRLSHMFFFP
jgi:hypothetical protein